MKQGDVTTQDEAVVLPNAFVGVFSRNIGAASGTQAVTGVGFRPSHIIAFSSQNTNKTASFIGFSDGTNDGSMFDNKGTADTYQNDSANFVSVEDSSDANTYKGSIQSFDIDGFTVDWVKVGAPSGTSEIHFIAFK
jgi:hypothetical protein